MPTDTFEFFKGHFFTIPLNQQTDNCTSTMDKLDKIKYQNEDILLKYRGEVRVPELEMIDDIADVQKCGVNAVKSNAGVN